MDPRHVQHIQDLRDDHQAVRNEVGMNRADFEQLRKDTSDVIAGLVDANQKLADRLDAIEKVVDPKGKKLHKSDDDKE